MIDNIDELTQNEAVAYIKADLCLSDPDNYSLDEKTAGDFAPRKRHVAWDKSGACAYNITVRQADSAPTWVRNERKDDGMGSTNGISPELAGKLKTVETEEDIEALAREEGLSLSDKQLDGIAGGRIDEKHLKCFATHHC